MKIRIFALAKELNLDSKLLLDYCARAGLSVKNSLSSLAPEECDKVRSFISSQGSGGSAAASAAAPAAKAESQAAPRDAVENRVRNIVTMTPRTPPSRVRPGGARTESVEPPAPQAVDTASAIAPPSALPVEPEPTVEEVPPPSAPALVVESEAESAPATVVEVESPRDVPPSSAVAAATAEAGPAAPAPVEPKGAEPRPISPMRRDDYIPATGVARPLRAMQSRGTSDVTGAKASAGPASGSPAPQPPTDGGGGAASAPPAPGGTPSAPQLPGPLQPKRGKAKNVAASLNLTFKDPPVRPAKGNEVRAQKPEVRFTQEAFDRAESPLAAHMKQQAEKRKVRPEDVVVDRPKDPRKPGERSLVDLEESRAQRRDKRRLNQTAREEEDEAQTRRAFRSKRRTGSRSELKTTAEIETPITIRSLSEGIGRPAKSILQLLMQQGEMTTINAPLSEDQAIELAMELGVDLRIRRPRSIEDELRDVYEAPDDPATVVDRPPIVTILGHVDHGKTTLVDKIRSANVAASEFGGITQHIAAYQVSHNDRRLTFVDTPGHAAFGEMRARGANVTDIVVLVVAANDGVMPQTIECISHARAAGVPMVVALNKSDLVDKNEQRVLQDLAQHNVLAAEWGGDIEVVRTSGLTGAGVNDLLDTLLLTADLHEFKANPSRDGYGACLEAFRDEGRGPIVWLIVQKGTLRVGDIVLCGTAYGRIRAMYDDRDREIKEAGPSTPVKVAGLDTLPSPGDRFMAVEDVDLAREVAEGRRQTGRAEFLASRTTRRTLDDILNAAKAGEIRDLNLVLKADTPGSIEALRHELKKFSHPEVRVSVLHEGVGGVNESDVYLASASNAVIVAFNVIAEDRAESLAEQEQVEIRRYNIIYELIDDIRLSLEGLLRPIQKQVVTGRAIVLQTFSITKVGCIAGCRVLNGTIERNHRIRLIRDQKILNEYGIASLKRSKDDAKEVREGMECGLRLDGFNDVKEGDLLEAFRIEEVKRTLDD